MAKILTGPLAAGISGKLGPVVFHQTRFGQVVQSKAKGKVHTTAPAMAAKSRFREAATAVGSVGSQMQFVFTSATRDENTNLQGIFISRYLRWRNGEPWTPWRYNSISSVEVAGHTSTGLKRQLTGTARLLDPGNIAFVFFWSLENGRLIRKASALWNDGDPQSTLSNRDVPEPFFALVFLWNPTILTPPFQVEAAALLDTYGYNLP